MVSTRQFKLNDLLSYFTCNTEESYCEGFQKSERKFEIETNDCLICLMYYFIEKV